MKVRYISIMLIFTFMVSGCSDWLHEDDSSKLTYDFYSTEQGIDAALVATYSSMRWGAGNKARYNMRWGWICLPKLVTVKPVNLLIVMNPGL